MPAILVKAENVTSIKSHGKQKNVEIHKIAQFSGITVKQTHFRVIYD